MGKKKVLKSRLNTSTLFKSLSKSEWDNFESIYWIKMLKLMISYDNHLFCSLLIEGTMLRCLWVFPYAQHFTCYLYLFFISSGFAPSSVPTVVRFQLCIGCKIFHWKYPLLVFIAMFREHECLPCFCCNFNHKPYISLWQFLLSYKARLWTH